MTSPRAYDTIGHGYAQRRHADPRIAAKITAALGEATSVVNVGAGAGSYEPRYRDVVAVEPSSVMARQRPRGAAPVVRAVAEALPFPDASFDAVLAILTIHHWSNWRRGLEECVRVARRRIVLLTWDPHSPSLWLVNEYFPEILSIDLPGFPSMSDIAGVLGDVVATPVPIPADCTDGFLGAYWRRPTSYLDETVRAGISTFSRIADPEPALARLRDDLATGEWARRHASLLHLSELDIGYRLIVADLGPRTSIQRE